MCVSKCTCVCVVNVSVVEQTVAQRWLLQHAVRSLDIEFDNVMGVNGVVETKTLGQMITEGLFPESHQKLRSLLLGKTSRDETHENLDGEVAVAGHHPDEFYGTSCTHPLRNQLRVDAQVGSFDMTMVANPFGDPPFVDSVSVFGRFSVGQVALHSYLGPLARGVECSAQLNPDQQSVLAVARIQSTMYQHAHTGLHLPISLDKLPHLSDSRGAQAKECQLGLTVIGRLSEQIARKVWATSPLGVGPAFSRSAASGENNWTTERLLSAINCRLQITPDGQEAFQVHEFLGPVATPKRVFNVLTVSTVNAYQIGRERFGSAERLRDARAYALVICPLRDRYVHDSPTARSFPHIFQPELLEAQMGIPEGQTRSFLHPVHIRTYFVVRVEVVDRDYVMEAPRRDANSGYAVVSVPFALVRYLQPHAAHRAHPVGDLSEIWSARFERVLWGDPVRVASHLVPLNRLAGKWSPAFLTDDDVPEWVPKADGCRKDPVLVLRHPLH